MYEKLKDGKLKREKTIPLLLLAAVVFFTAVAIPIFIATSGSYRYHRFVNDLSERLVYTRRHGELTLKENGVSSPLSSDNMSGFFMKMTEYGMGQQVDEAPDAEHIVIYLSDGSVLTVYSTPEDNGDIIPTGVTFRYEPSDGKTFMYLQRYLRYEDLVSLLHL